MNSASGHLRAEQPSRGCAVAPWALAAPMAEAPEASEPPSCWRVHPYTVASGTTCLFLGATPPSSANASLRADESPPPSPTRRPTPRKRAVPGLLSQQPVLALGVPLWRRAPDDLGPEFFYFEVFIRTTGGGINDSGSIGVGLADPPPEAEASASDGLITTPRARTYLHYHGARGARYDLFPRPASRSTLFGVGPSFGKGDTIGCGWSASGEVFFTINGRHLGVAFADVWGALVPAVDVDTPGANFVWSTGAPNERPLRCVRHETAS